MSSKDKKRMMFQRSPKIFKDKKSDYPLNTIKNIEEGFKKIGLKISYEEIHSGIENLSSGQAYIEGTDIGSFGKGSTTEEAKASAYGELVERFSAGNFWPNGYHLNPFCGKEIPQNFRNKIGRGEFLRGYEYSKKRNNNKYYEIKNFIPHDLIIDQKDLKKIEDSEIAKHWVNSFSIIKNKTIKVPLPFLVANTGSTGLAAGNTLEEAIVEGAYEIFERYVLGKVVLERKKCPTINKRTIKDKRIKHLISLYESRGINIILKDFSLEKRFPCIGVLFVNRNIDDDKNPLTKGYFHKRLKVGCNLNMAKAIKNCLEEEIQGLNLNNYEKGWASLININFDKLYTNWKDLGNKYYANEKDYNDIFDGWARDNFDFLLTGKIISTERLFKRSFDDFYDELEEVKKICKRNSLDFLFINLKNKEINFPVVRVVIPKINSYVLTQKPTPLEYLFPILKKEITPFYLNKPYLINNFKKYLNSWNWNKDLVQQFINDVEEFLSYYLMDFELDYYGKSINLFELLGFAYLKIGKKDISKKYFTLLKEAFDENYDSLIKIIENNEELDYQEAPFFSRHNPFEIKDIEKEQIEHETYMEKLAKRFF